MNLLSFFKSKKKIHQVIPVETKSGSPFVVMMSNSGNVYGFSSFSSRQIIDNYSQVAPLNTAVNKIADSVAALPCKIINQSTKEEVKDHPFIKFLNHPNSEIQKTKIDFFRQIVIWRILEGDAYVEMTGGTTRPPLSAFVWNPCNINTLPGSDGFIKEYRRILTNSSVSFLKEIVKDRSKFYTKDNLHEMIAWSNFNPLYSNSDLTGMSEVQPLFYEVNQYLLASNHNMSLLENGARPSGALMLKRKEGEAAVLTDIEFERLKAQVEDSYSGSDNTGRPLILEGGMEWQEMSITPKDMDFNISKDKNEQQIYKNLGVPIQLVMDVGTTYNNMKESTLFFYENRVLPLADEMFNFLTNNILHSRYPDSENLALVIDKDNVDALRLKRTEAQLTVEKSPITTLDEKREAIGLPKLGKELGGDAVYTTGGTPYAGDIESIKIVLVSKPNNATGDDGDTDDSNDSDNSGSENDPSDGNNNDNPDKSLKNSLNSKKDDNFDEDDILNIISSLEQPTVIASTLPLVGAVFAEVTEAFGEEFVQEIGVNNVFAITERVEKFIRDHSGEFITQINTTTLSQLRASLSVGFEVGETGQELFDRIESVFSDSRMSDSSIRRIGETESTRLASAASLESMTQADIDKKEWLTQQDGKVRGTHTELMGQIQSVEENFEIPSNGSVTLAPGGFGLAEEDINCRCAVVAVFEEKSKPLTDDEKKQLWFKREGFRITQDAKIQAMATEVFTIQLNHIRRLLRG